MEEKILKLFEEAAQAVLDCGKKNASLIFRMARELITCFERGGKLLIFGNGGSAAHAQHFAAELVNKLCTYRKPLPAIAINTDSSILTSIGNDLSFDDIFSRQIEALGNREICLVPDHQRHFAKSYQSLQQSTRYGYLHHCFFRPGWRGHRKEYRSVSYGFPAGYCPDSGGASVCRPCHMRLSPQKLCTARGIFPGKLHKEYSSA